MKIVIPVIGFAASGGMRVLSKLADEFMLLGHEVVFLSGCVDDSPYFPTSAKILSPSSHSLWCFLPLFFVRYFYLYYYLLKFRYFYGFDVAIANHNLTAFPVYLSFFRRSVYYIQAYEPEFFEPDSFSLRLKILVAKLTYLIPMKRIVNADLYKNYKEIKAEVCIPPGIDLTNYYPRPFKAKGDPIVVGCIGRKEAWKGTQLIINACLKARSETGLDIKLKVAFNVPDGFDILKYDFVELVMPHGDKNLADYYRALDLMIAIGTIQSGAFHYPCMEAMACGVPVISNYAPLCVTNDFFVDPVNEEQILDKIQRYLSMSQCELYDFQCNSQIDCSQFSWEEVSKKFCFYLGR